MLEGAHTCRVSHTHKHTHAQYGCTWMQAYTETHKITNAQHTAQHKHAPVPGWEEIWADRLRRLQGFVGERDYIHEGILSFARRLPCMNVNCLFVLRLCSRGHIAWVGGGCLGARLFLLYLCLCVRVQACACKVTIASMRNTYTAHAYTHPRRNTLRYVHNTLLSLETSVLVSLSESLSSPLLLARARSLSLALSPLLTPSHSDLHDSTLALHHSEVNPSPCCAFALLCSF